MIQQKTQKFIVFEVSSACLYAYDVHASVRIYMLALAFVFFQFQFNCRFLSANRPKVNNHQYNIDLCFLAFIHSKQKHVCHLRFHRLEINVSKFLEKV